MELGPSELLILLVILLVLFGGSQLPKLARSVGQARRELAAASDDEEPLG
ncbi:MAG: twin-arginine translocase TatA/TatE family subunit [Actinobacteria bacterium]|nr:twin-arginine translocase TatA/TatE family subunit [Actinomycetota bacterium]